MPAKGVATFTQPDYTTQSDSTQYPVNIDHAIKAMARVAAAFAPHAAEPPDLTVLIDAGAVLNGTTLTEAAQQTTAAFVAPSVNPRIDRVMVSKAAGALAVVAGVEAASPSPPAITAGHYPVAQVHLTVGMPEITNADITDERCFWPG